MLTGECLSHFPALSLIKMLEIRWKNFSFSEMKSLGDNALVGRVMISASIVLRCDVLRNTGSRGGGREFMSSGNSVFIDN